MGEKRHSTGWAEQVGEEEEAERSLFLILDMQPKLGQVRRD